MQGPGSNPQYCETSKHYTGHAGALTSDLQSRFWALSEQQQNPKYVWVITTSANPVYWGHSFHNILILKLLSLIIYTGCRMDE